MREDLRTENHLTHPNHMDRREEKGLQIRSHPTDHLVGIREVPLGDHRHHRHLLHLLTLLTLHQVPQ
jgi:hypothetical protein